ncbi:MAG: hypothetical protein HC888_18970 [Candidatus Competibacteraceae bacterium]|nr:hypothetical protein [Candidatus Competibacteraceae bacterium]
MADLRRRQALKDAFDRQARVDGTDHTVSECPDVHGVMSCSFVIDAFARDVPEEAKAAGATAGEMPDEVMDILGPGSEPVSSVGLDGNGATPARRYHYLGQFKTLIRVLSPAIDAAEIDRLIYDLQLGATPQRDLRTGARRPFADIACAQGGGASAISSVRRRSRRIRRHASAFLLPSQARGGSDIKSGPRAGVAQW